MNKIMEYLQGDVEMVSLGAILLENRYPNDKELWSIVLNSVWAQNRWTFRINDDDEKATIVITPITSYSYTYGSAGSSYSGYTGVSGYSGYTGYTGISAYTSSFTTPSASLVKDPTRILNIKPMATITDMTYGED